MKNDEETAVFDGVRWASARVRGVEVADGVLIREPFHDALQVGTLRADELAHLKPFA